MIKQTDIQARLRLLRYGLLVVVIMAFAVSVSYPIVALHDRTMMDDFLGRSLLYTAAVAVVCVVVYVAYKYILERTMGKPESEAVKETKEVKKETS